MTTTQQQTMSDSTSPSRVLEVRTLCRGSVSVGVDSGTQAELQRL